MPDALLAVIPARAGSKRIPGKNIRSLGGRPLLTHTVEAALMSGLFARTVVSTDSPEIAELAVRAGAEVPFIREQSLADDHTPVSRVTVDVLHRLDPLGETFGAVAQLMANCPLRTAEDVRESYRAFCASGAPTQLSVTRFGWQNPWWALTLSSRQTIEPVFQARMTERSQDLPPLFCPTGAIWWARAEVLRREETYHVTGRAGWEIAWERGLDIDSEDDGLWLRRSGNGCGPEGGMAPERLAVFTTMYPAVIRFLPDWVRSVAAQTDSDFDLWIGLDGVVPEDLGGVTAGLPQAPRWIVGCAGDPTTAIRSRAISQLAEEYDAVVFVDSDDVLHARRVAAAREALARCDLVGCALRIMDEEGQDLGSLFGPADRREVGSLLPRYNVFGLSNTAYRSDHAAALSAGARRMRVDRLASGDARLAEWRNPLVRQGAAYVVSPVHHQYGSSRRSLLCGRGPTRDGAGAWPLPAACSGPELHLPAHTGQAWRPPGREWRRSRVPCWGRRRR